MRTDNLHLVFPGPATAAYKARLPSLSTRNVGLYVFSLGPASTNSSGQRNRIAGAHVLEPFTMCYLAPHFFSNLGTDSAGAHENRFGGRDFELWFFLFFFFLLFSSPQKREQWRSPSVPLMDMEVPGPSRLVYIWYRLLLSLFPSWIFVHLFNTPSLLFSFHKLGGLDWARYCSAALVSRYSSRVVSGRVPQIFQGVLS